MGFVTNTSQPHLSAHIDILHCLIEIIEAGAPHCDGTKITSTDSASRLRWAGLDPANARKEDDDIILQQLTAAASNTTRPKYPRGPDRPNSCDIALSNDMPGWKYAFALSKDEVKAATPPGTVRLVEYKRPLEDDDRPLQQQNVRDDAPSSPEIDLAKFPIPTSDPSDPLNWARWRKLSCLGTLCNYAFACSFVSASLSPALAIWNQSFPTDPRGMSDLSRFTALNVLLLGLGNIVFVPLANVFGRRIVLVLSALTLFIATVCGTRDFGSGTAEHGMGMYEGVLVIRIFQGLGSSVSETVGPAVVGDMFFVQERGGWMALYTACLASGSVIGGICGGYIATRYGWFGIFWISTVLTGMAFVTMVLLVPETLFERGPLCFPTITTAPRERHRHRHRNNGNDDIGEEEKEIDGANENHNRRSGVRRYYHQHVPTPYLSLGTLPSIRMTMPSRFIASVYTPLNINTNQPQYFRDYWDPRLGLTWYETASESDDSEERFPTVYGRGSPLPTGLRPPPTAAARGGREAAGGGLPPGPGGLAARRATARGPRYRLYPPSEINIRPFSRGGNQNRPIIRKPENNAIGLSNRFTLGPFNRDSASSIPSSEDASTHYEPYTYLRSLRFFPPQQHTPARPFDSVANPFPKSPYSPYSPNFPKPFFGNNDYGYAEAESRLLVALPGLVIATGGLLVWGFCGEYGPALNVAAAGGAGAAGNSTVTGGRQWQRHDDCGTGTE
ncbi:unnamed protein product [Sordaria macrospora k-hell]|uniref:WGS project CABT00000000 data, contig 2.22 n=1 Tax=Sordaria macrospora (strain ATCC MYA-333 / DSM 997 / K(L3346) / K-hell) TaxID=771870 RepID=F7W2R0_SORMK|nr:uncharacterized protein SMAC_05124 [Sordaria macrospora k-hell]CCC11911.1 unnamed protein product [Sordaria macrospora k-hell]